MTDPTRTPALDPHAPEPDFLAQLEWQTRRALRRRARFDRPVVPGRRSTAALRLLILIGLSWLTGAGVVVAAQRVQEGRDVRLLRETLDLRLGLAERRLEAAEAREERVRRMHEQGLVSTAEIDRVARARLDERLTRDHLRLDREELEATRRAPDPSLAAPRAAGRDWVAEHLELDLEGARASEALARRAAEHHRGLYEAGLLSTPDLEEVRCEHALAEAALAHAERRRALRSRFLAGDLDPVDLERAELRLDAETRRDALDLRLASLEPRLATARALYDAGRAGSPNELELERDRLRVERDLVTLELESLR